ncbi:MAG: hypothetical protein IT433_10315 [Phycisphaerales bacterium]|nr:hypothetical protein [Phycisphaerales bacterium]
MKAGVMLTLLLAGLAQGAQPVVPVLSPSGVRAAGVQRLVLNRAEYERLRGLGEFALPDVPLAGGLPYTLSLKRLEVFTDDAVIVAASDQGEVVLPRPDLQAFAGTVEGVPGSVVFIGLSPEGVSGFVQLPEGTAIISSGEGGVQPTVIYNTFGPDAANVDVTMPVCQGAILPPGVEPQPVNAGSGYGDRVGECRALRLAVDCDTEFTADRFAGNQAAATTYVGTLVGAMTSIYRAEINAGFQLSYLRLWTGTDPYTATSNSNQLPEFRTYWNTNMGSVQRNLAHLMSSRSLGGGIAYLNAVCGSSAYGVSANMAGTFPYPIQHNHSQNWDLMVVSHEIGHNCGSGHTHDPAHFNPPVDGCGSAYLNPPGTQDCTAADLNIGTIMSYCHVCSGGMTNMRMEFGPRPAAAIRNLLDSRPTCGITPSITITQQPASRTVCAGESVTFSVASSGAGDRTYQWRRNGNQIVGTASSLTVTAGAATSGSYDCIITATCVTSTSNAATLTVINPCTCDPDLNQDGNVDQDDVTYLINVVGGATNPTGIDPDFNRDGNVDQDDVSALISVVAGGACP